MGADHKAYPPRVSKPGASQAFLSKMLKASASSTQRKLPSCKQPRSPPHSASSYAQPTFAFFSRKLANSLVPSTQGTLHFSLLSGCSQTTHLVTERGCSSDLFLLTGAWHVVISEPSSQMVLPTHQ